MKTFTLPVTILLILCLPITLFAQKDSPNLIKNWDFERFTGDNPDGWDTSNIPGTLTVVSAAKISKSGAHAVKCEVKDFYGSLIAGYVCQKNLPLQGKDIRLTASLQVHAVGKDHAVIVLCFQNTSGSTIGTVEEYIEDTNSKWTDISKEFKLPVGSAMAQLRLTLLSAGENEKVHAGSYLVCDDLKLATFTVLAPAEKPLIQ